MGKGTHRQDFVAGLVALDPEAGQVSTTREVEVAVLKMLFTRGQKTFSQMLLVMSWAGVSTDKKTLLDTLEGLREGEFIDRRVETESLIYRITASGAKRYERAARELQIPSQSPTA
jgi:hypothetical protein